MAIQSTEYINHQAFSFILPTFPSTSRNFITQLHTIGGRLTSNLYLFNLSIGALIK